MQIVADANIPYVQEAFASLGKIRLLPGREISTVNVQAADVLLVRSVTPVNAELLEGSRVRFVGSATIGVDHIDLPYLEEHKIAFAYAPGSNANSVAEYVIAAILAAGIGSLSDRTLGIIGLGRIGTLVKAKTEALGMRILANDPPLARAGQEGFVPLDALLAESDVVTCHVPLTVEGPDATYHLLDRDRLSRVRKHAVVMNTSRGAVVDNSALLEALRNQRIGGAVLDVWEEEPSPDPDLIRAVTFGTPHIAGYSVDGKLKGTRMLYEEACAFLMRPVQWQPPAMCSRDPVQVDPSRQLEEIVQSLVLRSYDIRQDDAALRETADMQAAERAVAFDCLRASYPARYEFKNTPVLVPGSHEKIRQVLTAVGFVVRLI